MAFDFRSPDFAPQQQPVFQASKTDFYAGRPREQQQEEKPKRSFRNVMGEIADVLALAGGSQPMYQISMDRKAEAARQAQADRAMQAAATEKAAGNKRESEDVAFNSAARALARYADDDPNVDVAPAIERVAQTFGLSPEKTDIFRKGGREAIRDAMSAQRDPNKIEAVSSYMEKMQALKSNDPVIRQAAQAELKKNTYIAPQAQQATPSDVLQAKWYSTASPRERDAYDKLNGQGQYSEAAARSRVAPKPRQTLVKPLGSKEITMQENLTGQIAANAGVNADIGGLYSQLKSGKLDLGLANNHVSRIRNFIGASTQKSRNYSSFQKTLGNVVNTLLLSAKGTQTEGDAKRAAELIMDNPNDNQNVMQGLIELQAINRRLNETRKYQLDDLRSNRGLAPIDTSRYERVPSARNLSQQQQVQAAQQQRRQQPSVQQQRPAAQSGWKVTEVR